MRRAGTVRRLTIIVREDDQYHHHALYAEIVQRARNSGLVGATVLRGVQGFGAADVLHQVHTIMDTAPVQITVIDTAERVDAFAAEVSPLVNDGVVLVDDVSAIRYDRG